MKLGQKHTESAREKNRVAHLGRVAWNKGTHITNSGCFQKGHPTFLKNHSEKTKARLRVVASLRVITPEHRAKITKSLIGNMVGKKHWNWKGGVTPENAKVRASLEIKLWREACMNRDDFTCQKTGLRGGDLVVHHINNFKDFPELRTSIANGITLSKQSHLEFHKKYGFTHNTREQLEEFLMQN